MKYVKAILVTLCVMLLFVLAIQNYENLTLPVTFRVNLGFFQHETQGMPLALVAVITFIIGVLACGLYGISELYRLKSQVKKLRKEAEEKDAELNSLRNLPVTSEDINSDRIPD
jgi:ATP adenylyltransferase